MVVLQWKSEIVVETANSALFSLKLNYNSQAICKTTSFLYRHNPTIHLLLSRTWMMWTCAKKRFT